jgi:hypothetical protein
MLTALPSRFHFEAIGLAGFRVPQKSRPVKAPGNCILEGRFQPNRGWLGCTLNLATD